MGLFDRLSRVVRANLNDAVSKAEDPEKILEQAVIDMQEDLVKLRQAVATAMASLKRNEALLAAANKDANDWQARAVLALNKGEEALAREALFRKKGYSDSINALAPQVEQQKAQVDSLKKQLIAVEGKIAEAKTKKNILKSRAQSAKASQKVQETLSGINPASALSAFDRMEEKVLELEAKSQAAGELAGTGLDQQFAALESGSDVEDELALLKAQMNPTASLPPASGTSASDSLRKAADSLDAELEQLRRDTEGK